MILEALHDHSRRNSNNHRSGTAVVVVVEEVDVEVEVAAAVAAAVAVAVVGAPPLGTAVLNIMIRTTGRCKERGEGVVAPCEKTGFECEISSC